MNFLGHEQRLVNSLSRVPLEKLTDIQLRDVHDAVSTSISTTQMEDGGRDLVLVLLSTYWRIRTGDPRIGTDRATKNTALALSVGDELRRRRASARSEV